MKKNPSGFTLIELVVVLTVIAVMAAVATPNIMRYMSRVRLGGASRLIMSDMMWARMQAVTQQNEFRIFFLNENQYVILDDDDNDGKMDSGEWQKTKSIKKLYHDVRMRSNVDPIFFPRGNASMGAVMVENPAGKRKVTLHTTGRVKIK
jgi:type IV fimbrial biogenesis protein FimT